MLLKDHHSPEKTSINFRQPALFIFLWAVFYFSPVDQLNDSHYSLLLSETLIEKRTFQLDNSFEELLYRDHNPAYEHLEWPYQIHQFEGHAYYWYPPGSSILAIPYVWLMNRFEVEAHHSDWSYNIAGEIKLERLLAALLMAALGCLFYHTFSRLLPKRWSLALALIAALGTPVWSTASRAAWSSTWGILFLQLIIDQLVALHHGKRRLNPILLGTLTAWLWSFPHNQFHFS